MIVLPMKLSPCKLALDKDCADLWVINTHELVPYQGRLHSFLDGEERQKLQRFTNLEAKATFLYSRGLLRFLTSCYTGSEPQKVRISTGNHGKPYIEEAENFFFNLSHSGGLLAYLFAGYPVGLDIEDSRRKIELEPIMKRFFSLTEIESWKKFSAANEKLSFFRGWTRKEAFLKATGEGISGLSHSTVSFEPNQRKALTSRFGKNDENEFWFFYDLQMPEFFVGSAVIKHKELALRQRSLLEI
ncbi:MAG: 4-phosphopantetheinyl transferase [Clostridiales bacterium]|nr:4-phosphopantetheinyl transferase [Clostridiales bacterium]MDN5283412.1 4-phosphopantetheinyl transferase [Candidatus Ozemobacter sp.]